MRNLDREVKAYLKQNVTDLAEDMNSAFTGTKEKEKEQQEYKSGDIKSKRILAIMSEAGALDPILEESAGGG